MDTTRCKMKVTSIAQHAWNPSIRTVRLDAVYSPDIPEDERFHRATPSAHFEAQIDNPTAINMLELGADCYVDITVIRKKEGQ